MADGALSRREVLIGAGAAGLGAITVGTGVVGAAESGRHIVGTSTQAATERAKREADSVHRVLDFGHIGQAIAGEFSDEALKSLERNPNVRYIEADGEMHAIGQTLPWGIDRVDADILHDNGETGSGADIAIIDTGIDSDHPDLQANIGVGKAFVECGVRSCSGPPCFFDCSDKEPWDDDNDHGTHCAGIADAVNNDEGVVGVSTEATLHAVKVLDCGGCGSFSDVAAGIEFTADEGWDVGSMSLGASSGSQTVKDACQYAYDKGVLLVAAAGNDGPCSDCVGYPAAYSTVMAISSTDEDDSLSSYSSTGPEIELAAPGRDIYSTVIGGYDTFSGTSMACPHVSGAGGQLMANDYTNTEARTRLQDTAEDIGLSSNEQGHGLLDAEAAVLGGDSAPSVSWVNPSDGETVSGKVTVQINASDSEDADDSLDVTYTVDDGSPQATTYNDESGYYEGSWDTNDFSDGDHSLEAQATDSAGNTSTATITVSVSNTSSNPTIDTFDVTEAGSPNPHLEIMVDWGVNDSDGDLSLVRITAEDSDGSAFGETHEHSVSGSSASGTDDFKFKHADGETADVTIYVEDSAGNSVSDTDQVSE